MKAEPEEEDESSSSFPLEPEEQLLWFREQWKQELKSRDESKKDKKKEKEKPLSRSLTLSKEDEGERLVRFLHWKEEQQASTKERFSIAKYFKEVTPCVPEEETKETHISSLPPEMLMRCFYFIKDPVCVEYLSCVCKQFFVIAREPSLWRSWCVSFWGYSKLNELSNILQRFNFSWRKLFLCRPILRLDGAFISRNSYWRPGQTEFTYYQPVHHVLYYRYFRFFPNGQVIYTMSTTKPRKVARFFHPLLVSSKGQGLDIVEGTYTFDSFSGLVNVTLYEPKKGRSSHWDLQLECKYVGKFAAMSVVRYCGKSASGYITEYPSDITSKFFFNKIPQPVLAFQEEQIKLLSEVPSLVAD
eukprot:CAMPEP_0174263074 /NCGR_PEP_ID=MMETSP0439-20130205/17054_1 /TAXON_ID=0 /ORGANISM="Stereomyxa ramosa, Strain Chinc5" /LENGTH=357 /DNA_ID=CAMNT_0015348207 /DNA_START=36 /DNA_END=1109 /DNA_ORIENTATION=-